VSTSERGTEKCEKIYVSDEECEICQFTYRFVNKLGSFDCGADEQNRFIRELAVGHYIVGLNNTFLLLCNGKVIGFTSFSNSSLSTFKEIKEEIYNYIRDYVKTKLDELIGEDQKTKEELYDIITKSFDISYSKLPFILLGQLGIHKDHQKRGVGKAFIEEFVIKYSIAYCIKNNCLGIMLHTTRELYEKFYSKDFRVKFKEGNKVREVMYRFKEVPGQKKTSMVTLYCLLVADIIEGRLQRFLEQL